jgi:hypothetical protein
MKWSQTTVDLGIAALPIIAFISIGGILHWGFSGDEVCRDMTRVVTFVDSDGYTDKRHVKQEYCWEE